QHYDNLCDSRRDSRIFHQSEGLCVQTPGTGARKIRKPLAQYLAQRDCADFVNFTPWSVELPPKEMVEMLNEIFSYFDSLLDIYGVEKIRTIGDNYMA